MLETCIILMTLVIEGLIIYFGVKFGFIRPKHRKRISLMKIEAEK